MEGGSLVVEVYAAGGWGGKVDGCMGLVEGLG